jgi:hypothetical protein
MTKMDNFSTLALHDPAHDINGGIMAIEQARSRYNPDAIIGFSGIILSHRWDNAQI